MLDRLNQDTVEFLVKAEIPVQQDSASVQNKAAKQQDSYASAQVSQNATTSNTPPQQFEGSQGYDEAMAQSQRQSQPKKQPVVADKKINRNEPCPCGSGKKYKQCHGRS
jgi:preprotein translocase subunit SecA